VAVGVDLKSTNELAGHIWPH